MAGSVNYIKSGQLKAFAVTGTERLAAFPGLPTFAEEGLPKFDLKNWVGVMVRAGTPKAIVDKLAKEIAVILAQPDVKETFAAQGLDPFISTPEQFTELIKSDLALYGQVIKTANIKLE
jgi:tripartite-type tricarboxylate transporter receptor subunit TctC